MLKLARVVKRGLFSSRLIINNGTKAKFDYQVWTAIREQESRFICKSCNTPVWKVGWSFDDFDRSTVAIHCYKNCH